MPPRGAARALPIAAVVALAFVLACVAVDSALVGPAVIVALGLVGVASSRTEIRAAGTLGLLSGLVMTACALSQSDGDRPALAAISGFAVGVLPALAGERLRGERVRTREARESARRIEELRDRDVQRAVAEERLRIARDVHDITGHHLSAISLQAAGGGRQTTDSAARSGFERIHRLTTEALGQTKRSLGVLRQEPESATVAPPPRLAQVERLLEPARAAGIEVELRIEGDARELSELVEMCAYRVVQESLTNVVRHARAESARVRIDYGAEQLELAVEDDGAGDRDGGARPGSGIEGMRERVALVGGSLSAGPEQAGGWSVRATLPLEERP